MNYKKEPVMHEIEAFSNGGWRRAVPGGWFYVDPVYNDDGAIVAAASCFVPDPDAPHVRDGNPKAGAK